MQGIAFVLYVILGLFQVAATIGGLQVWFGLHWLLATVIALFLASWPLVGTALGVFGAHAAWGWSWLSAFLLFFGPLLAIGAIALVAAAVERASRRGVRVVR